MPNQLSRNTQGGSTSTVKAFDGHSQADSSDNEC